MNDQIQYHDALRVYLTWLDEEGNILGDVESDPVSILNIVDMLRDRKPSPSFTICSSGCLTDKEISYETLFRLAKEQRKDIKAYLQTCDEQA